MRKRLLVSAGVILAAAFVAVWAVKYLERYERLAKLARGRLIDQEHYGRIKEGMSRTEVEATLGGPAGDFRTESVYYLDQAAFMAVTEEGWEFWSGDQGRITIAFDEQGHVRWRDFGGAISDQQPPPAERLRVRLRREVRRRLGW